MKIVITVSVLLVLLPMQASSSPEYEPGTVREAPQVASGDWRVDAIMSIVNGSPQLRASGQGGSGSGGGAAECEWSVRLLPLGETIGIAEPRAENAVAVEIRCGSALVSQQWVDPADVRDVDGEAQAGAQRYVESVLAPGLSMGTSPPANVLVGLDTWFWLDGWDGQPLMTTVVAPWGDSIDLELSLIDVEWNFGDGSPTVVADLGQPHPAESSVQHLYTVRSTSRAAPDGAFTVSATVRIGVRYWYDGQGPFAVAPLATTHTAPVVVRQIQAVLG